MNRKPERSPSQNVGLGVYQDTLIGLWILKKNVEMDIFIYFINEKAILKSQKVKKDNFKEK